MVDFKKALKRFHRESLKVFSMDEQGSEYWVGHSAQACYDHRLRVTGVGDENGFSAGQLREVSEDDMYSMKMEMEDGRVLTFRQAVDELIDLEVEFPRFLCGQES